MSKRFFITGTDTEVGKTVASSALLQAATAAGWCAVGYKPVASGCEQTAEGLRNEDALALQQHSAVPLRYEEVNPFAFAEPTSPHIVSAESDRPVSLAAMHRGLAALEKKSDWLLVEGAGGWYTPLGEGVSYADWVAEAQLPVVLVVGVRLGCINHALLTQQAILASGLPLAGWIANQIVPPGGRHTEYMQTLRAGLRAPLLGEIPHLNAAERQADLGRWVRLP
ncbi:dethiobiotin synthase [Pantoea sp. 1.19]|uniref:dethiobiotin synthase n=1 Tax=Pantoea sp. 1.19 TaxID=1925589 RepID=UPI000948971B|nr:dethiobiotin synthase [Pantoea sp. 1.19]